MSRRPDLFGPGTHPTAIMAIPQASQAEHPVHAGYLWYLQHRKFQQLGIDTSSFAVYPYAPSPDAYKMYGFKTAAAMCNLWFYETLNPSRMAFQYDPGEGDWPR